MRIHLKTSQNTTPVPFDYQQKLVGTIFINGLETILFMIRFHCILSLG